MLLEFKQMRRKKESKCSKMEKRNVDEVKDNEKAKYEWILSVKKTKVMFLAI